MSTDNVGSANNQAFDVGSDGFRRPEVVLKAAGGASAGGVFDSGPSWTPVRALKSSADASSASDLTAAPTSGLKIVIDDLWVSADTAMRVDILEETSGTVLWSVYLPANGSAQFTPRDGLKLDTADKKARIQASVAGNLRCIALYHSA